MAKNLLIVESPAKAKTIEAILGKDFEVKSCFGHIRDLVKNDMGIDVNNNFNPTYIVPPEKSKVVSELKSLAKKSDEVWLASDEDREGESISWHLAEVLGLDTRTTKRIVFHEITKPAILKAVSNPRFIDMNLVDAQQARRVVDRIVGFELSPVLWRKIGMSGGLSAGRVQSVAVKLIVEKEREINAFTPVSSFKLEATLAATDLNNKTVSFKAEGAKFNNETDAEKFLQSCIGADYKVKDIQVRPGKRTPAAPFTTSTLQQEASRKLGYGVTKTMLLAQKLYESGKITYMRTDSVSLGETAMDAIKAEIGNSFGNKYLQVRKYKNKNESAQEAHEAIRPTYMENKTVGDPDLNRLYELIWKRTIASQMADAELENTTAKINISTNNQELTASGQVIKFDGFLKVYLESTDEEEENDNGDESRLPNLTVGQVLAFEKMTATERFTKHVARYTEASLVKKLEELGIGRPSTYAPTISTIIKRNYVEKKDKEGVKRDFRVLRLQNDEVRKITDQENTGAEKSKLFPTDLGLVVTDFLSEHFVKVMDYSFTASIEKEFDEIADGKMKWNKMVGDFYTPFHEGVEHTLENADRAVGERILGKDESGKTIMARMGRYGPMVQIGLPEDEEKPRYAKLKPSQSIETISFQEAVELFKLGAPLGEYEGQEISVNIGRFGPYVKFGEQFVSIPKGEEASTVDLERAIEIIKAKKIEDAPVANYDNKPVTKGKGRFGPFIKWNDMFINVPARYNFDNLTQTDINQLIEAKLLKEANRYIQQWPEEKISLQNGRWGAELVYGKKRLRLPKGKYTADALAIVSLDEVKAMILSQDPKAFDKKASAKKKAATKKAAVKKK
ncbi:MAG: type I DNA topoisomerase [Ferruginibacter sp.]